MNTPIPLIIDTDVALGVHHDGRDCWQMELNVAVAVDHHRHDASCGYDQRTFWLVAGGVVMYYLEQGCKLVSQ